MLLMFDDFDKSKKTRNVRTIVFHPFSRRDLCYVSENKGFRFYKAKLSQESPNMTMSARVVTFA